MKSELTLHISERTLFAEGDAFGETGTYERIKGRVCYAVDPQEEAFSRITDLDKAPTNEKGLVEYSTDFLILKPQNPKKGNRRLFFDWGNRGNIRCLQFFNDALASNDPKTREHAGNGFLFRRGYTLVFAGWQGDLLAGDGRFLMDLPVASNHGISITGQVRSEFILEESGITTQPLSGWANTRSHPTVSLDTNQASLTRRLYADASREVIPSDQWMFARDEGGSGLDGVSKQTAIVPSDTNIYLPGGFETGWIYELVYTGRNPLVLGLGHPAVRDLISFLKYGDFDDQGHPNPLGKRRIDKAYGWGRSQTGRAIRDFVYHGYNEDFDGRKVFDGLIPHVSGAGLLWMNHRFANAVSPAGQEHEVHHNCADRFPFSYAVTTDHLTGKTDSILKRPASDPLIIHTQSATEYWQRRGSLVHTDTQGHDLEQPERVRVYAWGSSEHFADSGMSEPSRGPCQNLSNVVRTSLFLRSALDNLDLWATDDVAPPSSRYPRRSDGTLVDGNEWRHQFPPIPGVALPNGPAQLPLLDFGPDFEKGLLTLEPPLVLNPNGYPTLVPSVDSDGIDQGCLNAPMVLAPLATYTGWNLRARGQGQGAMHKFTGSTIPFAETPEEQLATADPRPSILERYPNSEAYLDAIRKAARQLVEERYMLEEDVERCLEWARDWDRLRHGIRLP
ncbi:MAG TPA: alpha/beta hydrolase domain-containing protein [SAR324 cluster bacterium]|jgi:hypothetical protein|nr:alpha/beta hydrolase domain-containing protein [SAR324 cluster bacterium]MEE1577658.1 alpha/beta hydrolase domain-containing protein [Deltaproteobacteria bacterium]HJO44499.1 alpha/beta hydrolase domain-containing protein [SAR324 cluster bacterium]|tara:strand:- start:1033 stop:3057 length:2025 start_codon:yes stop_codon:yes gene_type:complete